MLYEIHGVLETPKWQVVDVLFDGTQYHYWLVSFDKGHIFSFTSEAGTEWPKCFELRICQAQFTEMIAHPDDIREHVNKMEDLHYATEETKYKQSRRWTTLRKSISPQLYEELPLGKPYRAIDIGGLVPVFKLRDRLIGLTIK